jgi:hypothetical protein
MQEHTTSQRVAWSLAEIAESMNLSIGFLRNEVRRGKLNVKKFGRRTLVLDEELRRYLAEGSPKEAGAEEAA